jgi:hypothetical protein
MTDIRPFADERDEALAAEFGARSVTKTRKRSSHGSGRSLRLDPISTALQPKPIAHLIRNVLARDSLASLIGAAGTYKTFVSIDWMCCIATGTPWCGHSVHQGPVLLFLGEGRSGLAVRIRGWSIGHGVDLDGAPLFISNEAAALTDETRAAELLAVVAEFMRQHGAPVLIVFDTMNRNFGPADENSSLDMTRGVAVLDELRTMTGACILLLHHTGHMDKSRARGSSVLIGAIDSEWRTGRDEDGTVRLDNTKMKEGPEHEGLAFRVSPVETGITDDDGVPVTSVVLRPTAYAPPPAQGKAGRGKWQTTAMRILHDTFDHHRANVAKDGRDPGVARVSFSEWRDKCKDAGMPANRFHDVTESLINAGKIRRNAGFVELGEGWA